MQDHPEYNHMGYIQDSNLTNSKPIPNPNLKPPNIKRNSCT